MGAVSKNGNEVWTNMSQSEAGLYAIQMKSSGAYQSDLVNSYAWDTALIFIEKMGYTGYACQGLITDASLATGKGEWTTERSGNENYRPATARYLEYSTANRYQGYWAGFRGTMAVTKDGNMSDSAISFRLILFRT